MDDETKKKLDRILQLTEQNNAYIKKVRKTQKTAQMFRAVYWIIIIGIGLGAYFYAKQFFPSVQTFFQQANDNLLKAGITLPGSTFFQKQVK